MATITLKGNEIHTTGELPAVGTTLDNIVFTGVNLSDFNLNDYRGKKVLLNIFPSIDTGICAMSVRKFNEDVSKLENTVVLCVSADLPFAQNRFCGAEGIESVVMASDFRHRSFADAVAVNITDGPLAGLCSRAIIVLDENGNVTYTEQVPEITQEPNYVAAVAAIG